MGWSKVATGVAVGVATEGIGAALGASVGSSVAAGVATAAGIATGRPTTVGYQTGGNPGVFTNVNINDHVHAEFVAGPPPADNPIPRPHFVHTEGSASDYNTAKQHLEGFDESGGYGIFNLDGEEYLWAKDENCEFLSSRQKEEPWKRETYESPFTSFSMFPTQPLNMVFEETPLQWYFEIKVIEGRRYNHAWTNSMESILILEDADTCYFKAPRWYREKMGFGGAGGSSNPSDQDQIDQRFIEGYFREAGFGLYRTMTAADRWNFNDPNEHVTFARSCARTTLDYYSKALDAAEHFGLSEKFVNIPVAFLFPGGIENLENLANGKINGVEFLGKVGVDLAWSAATKPVQFISQLKKVDIKTATKFFRANKNAKGGSTTSKGARVQATKQDADNYLCGLENKEVLSEKRITKDGKEYYQFQQKCEYNGVKFKKGQYISRDELHHEWEWFGRNKEHKGAIEPLNGELYKDAVAGRFIKLP